LRLQAVDHMLKDRPAGDLDERLVAAAMRRANPPARMTLMQSFMRCPVSSKRRQDAVS
jgi:hypothetical protein